MLSLKVVFIYINAFETSENIFNNEHDKVNLSKTNSNRSICLCINCTKKGDGLHIIWDSTMKVKILGKVYKINEIFHQEWSTSRVFLQSIHYVQISYDSYISYKNSFCSCIGLQHYNWAGMNTSLRKENLSSQHLNIKNENKKRKCKDV